MISILMVTHETIKAFHCGAKHIRYIRCEMLWNPNVKYCILCVFWSFWKCFLYIFSWRVWNGHGFLKGIEMDTVFLKGWKWIRLLWRVGNGYDYFMQGWKWKRFSWRVGKGHDFFDGWNWIQYLWRVRNGYGFYAGLEMDTVFLKGIEMDTVFLKGWK